LRSSTRLAVAAPTATTAVTRREPGKLRPHIHVYVDKERAELETPLRENARLDVIAAISGG